MKKAINGVVVWVSFFFKDFLISLSCGEILRGKKFEIGEIFLEIKESEEEVWLGYI